MARDAKSGANRHSMPHVGSHCPGGEIDYLIDTEHGTRAFHMPVHDPAAPGSREALRQILDRLREKGY